MVTTLPRHVYTGDGTSITSQGHILAELERVQAIRQAREDFAEREGYEPLLCGFFIDGDPPTFLAAFDTEQTGWVYGLYFSDGRDVDVLIPLGMTHGEAIEAKRRCEEGSDYLTSPGGWPLWR